MASHNSNQPKDYDAVLGGQAPAPAGGVVLGGIEGVKIRLASAAVEQRVAALSDALKYGEAGLDLVIQVLQDESKLVQYAAYCLLKERQEPRVKQQLQNYLPWFEFDVVTVDAEGREINRRRSQAQFFEEDLGNGVTLAMVSIPSGTFLMGSPDTEEGWWWYDSQSPQHQVTVASFYVGKYPITQAQWKAVATLPQVNCALNSDPSYLKGANRPVEQVSWHDAVEFCARLSFKTGRLYRLPSEAEWEYAARAGTTTPFHFGKTITTDLANYYGNDSYGSGPKGIYRGQTTDVDSFPANAFGLYDIHGNVGEWCADHWHYNYHLAPSDGRVWDYGDYINSHCRMLRGGCWSRPPRDCCSAARNIDDSGVRDSHLGFRVVCDAARTS